MAAAVVNPAIIEAAQFLSDPDVQQTPAAMQMIGTSDYDNPMPSALCSGGLWRGSAARLDHIALQPTLNMEASSSSESELREN